MLQKAKQALRGLSIALLVWSLGASCSAPTICREGDIANVTTLDPNNSNCTLDCECNNQNFEGYCDPGTKLCVAQKREKCESPGRKQACKPLRPSAGSCTGERTCKPEYLQVSSWGDCKQVATQAEDTAERCGDGQDNDCDGLTDFADDDCKDFCAPGMTPPPCYSGPKESLYQGLCVPGLRRCDTKTRKWSGCQGETTPKDKEECNGKDDNCDGNIDEGIPGCPSTKCTKGEQTNCYTELFGCQNTAGKFTCRGVCKSGYRECAANQSWSTCQRQVTPQQETCGDGYDNDCDGGIDEGCDCTEGTTQKCYSGNPDEEKTGACRAGVQTCRDGRWGTCEGEQRPTLEVCNGRDDDCDGAVDNNLVAPDCPKQAGVCRGARAVCGGAPGWLSCAASRYLAWDASFVVDEGKAHCDGKDNDCDGFVDENCDSPACKVGESRACYSGAPATKGVGPCREGIQSCAGGLWGACLSERLPATNETCNGDDDDCNGKIDDGATCPNGQTCTNGTCPTSEPREEPTPEKEPSPEIADTTRDAGEGAIGEVADGGESATIEGGESSPEEVGPPEAPVDQGCVTSADCPPDIACVAGRCVVCRSASDCGAGKICLLGRCRTGNCLSHADCSGGLSCIGYTCKACTQNSECGINYFCGGGVCKRQRCQLNSDCKQGELCDTDSSSPTAYECRSCKNDSECGTTRKCHLGLCREPCKRNSDCTSNICQSGVCFEKCTSNSDCVAGSYCVSGRCQIAVEAHQGAYRWPNAQYAKNCTHYRFPPFGTIPATNSGNYWIAPTDPADATKTLAPFKAVCDMDTNGGGWTLMARYRAGYNLYNYSYSSHQEQRTPAAGGGRTLTTPPDLSQPIYGHIAYTVFEPRDREISIECRQGGTTSPWLREVSHSVFQKWSYSAHGTVGAGYDPNPYNEFISSWGTIMKNRVYQRSDQGPCGAFEALGYQARLGQNAIGYCYFGSRGNWITNRVAFSFRYVGPTSDSQVICRGKVASSTWEGRIWHRDQGPNSVLLSNGVRQWKDGTYARSCEEYKTSIGGSYTGQTGSGVYRIQPDPAGNPIEVFCDMKQRGGGWTLAFVHNSIGKRDLSKALTSNTNTAVLKEMPRTIAIDTNPRAGWLDLTKVPFRQFFFATYNYNNTTYNNLDACNLFAENPAYKTCGFALPIMSRSALALPFGQSGYFLNKANDASGTKTYSWCGGDTAYGNGTTCAEANQGIGAGWNIFEHNGTTKKRVLWLCGQNATNCNDLFRGYDSTGKVGVRTFGSSGTAIAIWIR